MKSSQIGFLALLATVSANFWDQNRRTLQFEFSDAQALNGADLDKVEENFCPPSSDGYKMVACPSSTTTDPITFPCIRFLDLCDSKEDCPNGEDEIQHMCFYHRMRKLQIKELRRQMQILRRTKTLQ